MKFRSLLNYGKTKPNSSGSVFRQTYVREIDPLSHKRSLVESDKINLVQLVQMSGKGLTVKDLINRFNAGDLSAIPEPVESYGDFTKSPKSLLEAEKLLINAKSKFDMLPLDIKSKYNNNSSEWLAAVNDGTFVSYLNEQAKISKQNAANAKFVSDNAPVLSDAQVAAIKKLIGGSSDA